MSTQLANVARDPELIELVKTMVIGGNAPVNDSVLNLYFALCEGYRFDPRARMLYLINRKGRWVPQVSIDGFRSIAEDAEGYAGQGGPFWCGPDGAWKDVWTINKPPFAAKVVVYREGFKEGLTGIALWSEYAPHDLNGNDAFLWRKMPTTMLAKCAEALALRKAFPKRLAGLYSSEEMAQAGNGNAAVVESPAPANGAASGQQTAIPPGQTEKPKRPPRARKPAPAPEPEPELPPHVEAHLADGTVINGESLETRTAIDPETREVTVVNQEPEQPTLEQYADEKIGTTFEDARASLERTQRDKRAEWVAQKCSANGMSDKVRHGKMLELFGARAMSNDGHPSLKMLTSDDIQEFWHYVQTHWDPESKAWKR